MERSVSVSSDRNIGDHLWRRSTYFCRNIPTEIRHSIFDNQGPVRERRNNSFPGINVPYFRDNFIPGINSVPERRNTGDIYIALFKE